MASYYINNNQQANGDYEVHRQGCRYFPTHDYTYVGEFYSCNGAVQEAKNRYPNRYRINGCYTCCKECHTT